MDTTQQKPGFNGKQFIIWMSALVLGGVLGTLGRYRISIGGDAVIIIIKHTDIIIYIIKIILDKFK